MSFHVAAMMSAFPALARAALVNIRLSLVIIALAVAGGTLLTVLRAFKIAPVNAAIAVLISFVRGTPLLIQIFICFYVLPAVGIDLGAELAGIVAIAGNSSVFISEVMRTGLGTIDPGQVEAATALALAPRAIWLRVVLPQLFRRVLPVLVNELTIIVKGTALLSVITVVDVLRTAEQIASATYRPFEVMVAAAVVFLAINLVGSTAGGLAEARLAQARA